MQHHHFDKHGTGNTWQDCVGDNLRFTGEASTLGEVTRRRVTKRMRQNTRILSGRTSAACRRGKHTECSCLTCGCPCGHPVG